MDYSDAFRLINLGVGGLMVVGGIYHIFPISISNVVIGIYVAIFGAEFQIPPQISRYASFLFSFVGRVYIFAGSILLENHILNIIFGTIIGIIGLCYVILEFLPSIEPPQNMREADAGWGVDQV
ncbi:Golgi apparatus membrane protein tvp15 [Erysiphe neolycopersici]|uniref:Golgi apparatus membrane protein tvp15 n=1 Tax=Erysiphe neolycopersici TaxID=212602 RepID=A0A420HK88_9PEZI|nr:Golgi apparatus membrane protein tvp15 [Erysiphe neolycopersici]